MIDWIKIRNDYIYGNISYRKLAEKHKVNYGTLRDRAIREKWFATRKSQRDKIIAKTEQKTAEKLAKAEADRLLRISNAADKLLEKIELATQQLDNILIREKRSYTTQAIDPKTQSPIDVYVVDEKPKTVQVNLIDRAGLKQLASTLKDIRDIKFTQNEETEKDNTKININVLAATKEDMEEE